MKFKIKKDLFLKELLKVASGISNKTLVPALTGIKIEIKPDELILIASDSDITIKNIIKTSKDLIIEKEGVMIASGKYFLEIIKKLPNDFINIEQIEGLKTLISTNSAEFTLNSIPPEDYPDFSFKHSDSPLKIFSTDLKKLIHQTSFSISTEEVRPLLTGINFNIIDNNLTLTATDSYRLSKNSFKLTDKINNLNITVPGDNLISLIKILEEDKKELEIHIFNNNILFTFENISFSSRILNGTYPDIQALIPSDFKMEIPCEKRDLYDVLSRVSLLIDDRNKNIVTLEKSDKQLILSSKSPEIGKAVEELTIEDDIKDNIKISFSAKYMMEALNGISSTKIILCFNSASEPIVIKNIKEPELIQLILPIKTY